MADVLIERSGFLASLEGLLREALDGSGRLVFLGGEAGVGKTTLATALADAVVPPDAAGMPGVVRMQLPPLTAMGVQQLLEAAGSALDADAIFQRTGGNPFYLTEVLAAGAEQVPATVRDAVLARVSRLSQAGRDAAAAASVLGRRAGGGFVAAGSGQPLTAIDECRD